VEAGFRKAGYKKIKFYEFNKSLVLICTIPKNADINQMGKIAALSSKNRPYNRSI